MRAQHVVNLFKHNPTISVRNTPECGTHYVTSIRTHNSQRTEHKYIDYVHPDDQTQHTFEMTPGLKPFTITCVSLSWSHSYLVFLKFQIPDALAAT